MSIIDIIKNQRFYKKALKKLLTAKDRFDIKEKTRYLVIDPDKASEDGSVAEQKVDDVS